MRILIADDSLPERNVVTQFLHQKGHDVAHADDGQEALEVLARERFDLVILDSIMPRMVGNEAVRQIRRQDKALGRYTPVLFVVGLDDSTAIVASLGLGADDYLTRPIQWDILEAKLRVFDRIASQHRALEQYRLASEDDKAFGRHVLDHLTRANQGFTEEVRHFTRPCDHLSGDLFAYARSADGTVFALLADAMGHGLAASLATVVLAQTFYTMVERNQSLDVIINEANATLRKVLPPGFFVAAAFVETRPPVRHVQVWNGGIPLVRLQSIQGVIKAFDSAHPALGVLPEAQFSAETDGYQSTAAGELLLATDGATEALADRLSEGSYLGFDEVVQRIMSVPTHDDATVAEVLLR
jgi:DNA-binding response OmpR family regulator